MAKHNIRDESGRFTSKIVSCEHERLLFERGRLERVVKYISKIVSKRINEFDAIVVSGYSMSLIAPIIAYKFDKNIVLVRKAGERHHSSHIIEGIPNQRCLIIDDLVSSGNTIKYINVNLQRLNCSLVGVILYNECYDKEWFIRHWLNASYGILWGHKEIR